MACHRYTLLNGSVQLQIYNIYFVNVSLDHGETGEDRVRCACKCNQAKSINTPN